MSQTNGKDKKGANNKLTKKVIPIVLGAIALFITVCFIFGEAGAFGNSVASILRGLFASGAYAIPLLLVLHAFFFAEDLSKGALLSRSVLSLITVLIISSIDYTIAYWGAEPVFDPTLFYSAQMAGGFIGGIFSFCITKLIGSVGLLILDATLVAVYAIIFFGRKESTARRGVLGFLETLTALLAVIEGKIKKHAEERREAKAEEKRQETERHHAELLDDQFFDAEGNMDEIKIRELGIHESKSRDVSEKNPTLQTKVHNKSAVSKEQLERERQDKAKNASLDFNIPKNSEKKHGSSDLGSVFFTDPNLNLDNTKSPFNLDQNADAVFTNDFDPFDFATGERLIAKQSTGITSSSKKQVRPTSDIMTVTEESLAEAKRREDFDKRRKSFLENRAMSATATMRSAAKSPVTNATDTVAESDAPTQEPAPTEVTAQASEQPTASLRHVMPKRVEPSVTTMEFGSQDDDNTSEADSEIKESSVSSTEQISQNTDDNSEQNAENEKKSFDDVAQEIADRVLMNNPAYARSANRSTFTTIVRGEETLVTEPAIDTSAESAASSLDDAPAITFEKSAITQELSSEAEATTAQPVAADTTEPAFKPFTPPTTESAAAAAAESPKILVTERELLVSETDESPSSFLERELARYSQIAEDTAEEVPCAEYTAKAEAPVVDAPVAQPAPVAAPVVDAPVAQPAPVAAPVVDAPEAQPAPVAAPVVDTPITQPAPIATPIIDDALFSATAAATASVASSAVEEESGTVFTFGDDSHSDSGDVIFDDGSDDDEDEDLLGSDIPEEDAVDLSPIPPEEQNPDVIKQRAMFPFLDEDDAEPTQIEIDTDHQDHNSSASPTEIAAPVDVAAVADAPVINSVINIEEDAAKDAEDDAPPFEVDAPTPKAALVPVEEKPKKKDYSSFVFPPIDLLHAVDEQGEENIAEEIQDNADKLIDTLASFGVTASIKGVDRGPRITRYEVVPARGIKVSSIMNLADDIALNLAADGIRMEAPIPGKTAVGVEIPNKKSSIVRLRELIETSDYQNLKSKTTVCMGKDVAGQPVFADVAKMPHALVAGATGMGKSVWINSLMLSILYKARPDEVKFIMIDPKQVEFTMYNGIPHLLVPVVTDVKQAAGTLMWAVEEMERRYGVLQELCVRNIDAYNDKVSASPSLGEPMSRIIIVIDEFAELIMQAKNPVESLIIRIAQKARAAGIHLIIGTQKPVKEVITGLIKSNIPSKFSCKVASNRDSILIFDASGAEKLLDKGDMLVSFANSIKPLRVQSAFVADDEVESVMEYLKQFSDGSNYDEAVMEEIKRAADKCSKKGGSDRDDDDDDDQSYGEGYLNDKQFLDAVEIAVNTRKISTSLIQRKLSIGYGKAAKFIDVMEDMGVVGEANGSKPREVLLSADEWHEKLARASYD